MAKHAMYRHEVEEPSVGPVGHLEKDWGLHEDKAQAMDIAYGQAAMKGCESDRKKMHSQMKEYHWEGASGMESGY